MEVITTPHTGKGHSRSVWDDKKTACGSVVRDDWKLVEGDLTDVTCDSCLKKMLKRKRKFTPARKFV